MKAIVTVFLEEFEGKSDAFSQLSEMSSEARQVGNAQIFFPIQGRLFEFLTVLKSQRIAYGTHFASKENPIGSTKVRQVHENR